MFYWYTDKDPKIAACVVPDEKVPNVIRECICLLGTVHYWAGTLKHLSSAPPRFYFMVDQDPEIEWMLKSSYHYIWMVDFLEVLLLHHELTFNCSHRDTIHFDCLKLTPHGLNTNLPNAGVWEDMSDIYVPAKYRGETSPESYLNWLVYQGDHKLI